MMSTAAPTRRPQFTDPRPTRRRRQRWAIALGIVVIVATTVWIVWFSSLLDVRDVRVLGAEGARADEVSTVASIPLGVPLARLDTAEAERALRQLPWVAAAEVRRG
ncbi:MAG: FtsQ-type POTRA domain-containing protein [Actinomycetota bacterium]|nr:FtsQ-type POTRA domain-containing protein [Actinomycetota bacterium]